ncbi:MAG: serine/threonine protein kinase, partial [Gemmataceae bacterium]|nr:serine/threonine protein kinase [Gemmataceae bacterium]
MTTTPPPDLDDAVLSYLAAVDAGANPDPAAWLVRYPQFADQLAPFFAAEREVPRVALATPSPTGADATPVLPGGGPTAAWPADRFEWGPELGRGGMGEVVRVRDRVLGRSVAVKVLQRRHYSRPGMVARFLDEARIAGGLQHPGVPSVHDVGTTPDGRPFLVMRLVEGQTLAEQLRQRPTPADDLPRFLKVFEQVAQTVAYAHSRGVVHRDLKPHNVMVGAFGEVQVMDWGLAKQLRNAECGMRNDEPEPEPDASSSIPQSEFRTPQFDDRTVPGTAVGTPQYMPPEQARGEVGALGPRADVFGLGAILCEVLTGRPPFAGPDPLGQAARGDVADAVGRLGACG